MGKGKKQLVAPKKKKGNAGGAAEDNWGEVNEEGGLPEAEEGIKTGARVWVSLCVMR